MKLHSLRAKMKDEKGWIPCAGNSGYPQCPQLFAWVTPQSTHLWEATVNHLTCYVAPSTSGENLLLSLCDLGRGDFILCHHWARILYSPGHLKKDRTDCALSQVLRHLHFFFYWKKRCFFGLGCQAVWIWTWGCLWPPHHYIWRGNQA